MHRPLAAGQPTMFNFQGICAEAAEDTNDQCVPHQLAKHIRLKGGEAPFTKEQLASELWQASCELYEDSEEDCELLDSRGVPVSGRHGDTAQTGTARSGTVPTRPDTVRHGPAWRGLAWLIEVRGLANRSEGSGQ